MSKVEVLCPNGHRVIISVSQTTKVIKILEEACLRKGFLPICEYEIRHGKKMLEYSASIESAGLLNLAKLELVKRVKPWVESSVLIQVQTSEGARMQRAFMPPDSLFEILEKFEEDDGKGGHPKLLFHSDKAMQPSICCFKEEIIGHFALRETTLKSMGILGGRVMFRHQYRQTTEKQMKEIEEGMRREKERMEKLMEVGSKLAEENRGSCRTRRETPEEREEAKERSPLAKKANLKPEEEKVAGSPAPVKEVVAKSKSSEMTSIASEDSFKSSTSMCPLNNPFANFKFPEATKGKDVYRNEFSEVKKEEFKACDREIVVYKLEEKMEVDAGEELPDSFFEITEKDLAVLQRDLENSVKRLSEQPLMTESMRRHEMEQRSSRYERVAIRIQFQDRTIVQGLFQPLETVYAIYKFVKELLRDNSIEFELYTAPPKRILSDKTQTLIEANLVPMTRIYFGSSPNFSDAFIRPEILGEISSRVRADEVVSKYIISARAHESKSEPEMKKKEEAEVKKEPKTKQEPNPSGTPKWLKLGKK